MTIIPSRRLPVLLAVAAMGFAAACASRTSHPTAATAGLPAFDSGAAWRHLEAQLAFGPRPVGVPAHERLKDYLNTELRKQTSDVLLQQWTDPMIHMPLTNLIARFPARAGASPQGQPVMVCGHWDTRPTADQDSNPANLSKPIPGANDGASETAVLLELARGLKANPPPVPVWLLFLDGEDYGPGIDRMFIGSRYFAGNQPAGTPKQAVLLDMIGDADLQVPKEINSTQRAPALLAQVWAAARRAGHAESFPDRVGDQIYDDHLPLLDAGIACIDLIDFSYTPWHTLADTADKCSARSLGIIGDTMIAWIYAQPASAQRSAGSTQRSAGSTRQGHAVRRSLADPTRPLIAGR
jgi:glutaminyl-peptide cyclotransferase